MWKLLPSDLFIFGLLRFGCTNLVENCLLLRSKQCCKSNKVDLLCFPALIVIIFILGPTRVALHDSQVQNNPYLAYIGPQCSYSDYPLSETNHQRISITHI